LEVVTVVTDEDLTAMRRRLRAAIAERQQIAIQRQERLSESEQRYADFRVVRAAMFRMSRQHARVAADVENGRRSTSTAD
jgi:hypothetical protein